MKERIQKFIDYKNITPGELADILEVQRSNISHILNGRNKPGASFIEKFLLAFPNVNARWLFTGEGNMVLGTNESLKPVNTIGEVKDDNNVSYITGNKENNNESHSSAKTLEKVVLLYSDGTFLSYNAD
ncbi:MAG: helix-turn-helix transcriptional regulator [Mariniphaga sp.]|jgi:predicted transcriptional regulator|nr:helix-turn-helix transcriptional regulator [Mariniphaga sp.]